MFKKKKNAMNVSSALASDITIPQLPILDVSDQSPLDVYEMSDFDGAFPSKKETREDMIEYMVYNSFEAGPGIQISGYEISSSLNLQNVYDNSTIANIDLAPGKNFTLSASGAGFRSPSLSTAQFQAIPSPQNGLQAWSSDQDRPIFNTGSPSSPAYKFGAFLDDLPSILADASYGGMHFRNNSSTTSTLINTPVKIVGTYLPGNLLDFTFSNGTLTYTGSTKVLSIGASLSIVMTQYYYNYEIALYKNGSLITESVRTVFVGGALQANQPVNTIATESFSAGDTLEVFITNTTSQDGIIVSDLNCIITSIGGATPGIDVTLQDAYDAGDGTIQVDIPKPFQIDYFLGGPYSLRVSSTVDAGVKLTNFGHGVTYTLATSLSPTTSYVTPNVFTSVWQSLYGSNIVAANSFQVGNTIEIDIVGVLSPVSGGGTGIVRIGMGSIFSISSQTITISGEGANATRNFQLRAKITRISSGVMISFAGWYESSSNVMTTLKMFSFPFTLAYDTGQSYALNVDYNNNSGQLDLICTNLNIIQHT
jgi:hypothetical protein